MNSMFKGKKGGFTLIELLVVIAIIGILSAVVLASLATARQKARDATRISDIKNMQLALELLYDGKQAYPGNVGNTAFSTAGLFDPTVWTASPFVPTYIPKLPKDPSSRPAAFVYSYVGLDSAGANCNGAIAAGAPTYTCASYLLGASLERDDNLVLTSDSDTTVAPFSGADAGACGDVTLTTAHCYDLKP